MMATAAEAMIGHNNPPEPTPLESFAMSIADLMETAQGFLDGDPVTTKELADEVGRLKGMCTDTARDAEKQRKVEKQPHLDAGTAVDEAWKPLIKRCETAKDVAQKALAPWLKLETDRIAAEAAEKKRIADEAAAAAQAALAKVNDTDLAAREEAEQLLKDAAKAEKVATKAGKARASVAGTGRAISLRTVWSAEIVDRRAALNAYIKTHPEAFLEVIQGLADHEARHGPRTTAGVSFKSEEVAQ